MALSALGVAALAIGGTALVIVPALWILLRPAYRSAVRSTLSTLPARIRSASTAP